MSSVEATYREFLSLTGSPEAAATLVLADATLRQQAEAQPSGDWLTIKQAAAAFNISERSLYRLTDLHHKNGRSVRIKRSELASHLEQSNPGSLFG